MQLITLGTSCAQHTPQRTQSAHLLRINLQDSYLVDCGSATGASLLKASVKTSSIRKIFLTHLHADHCIGLPALLADLLGGHGGRAEDLAQGVLRESTGRRPIDIYGPKGTQEFLRTNFRLTYTALASPFRVHELLFDDEEPFSGPPYPREEGSRIIRADRADKTNSGKPSWTNIAEDHNICVTAVAIQHTVPTLGFLFCENESVHVRPEVLDQALKGFPTHALHARPSAIACLNAGGDIILPDGTHLESNRMAGRTVVILGDTSNASDCIPHLTKRTVSLVLHEATNAYLPPPFGKPADTLAAIRKRAAERGHSTPEVAGAFAQAVSADTLVLTHFSSRYGGTGPREKHWMRLFETIASLGAAASQKTVQAVFEADRARRHEGVGAVQARPSISISVQGGFRGRVIAAWDGMAIDIPHTDVIY